MKIENKSILLISPERWGINFVSKHHYATELAKGGNMVFFLNPPGDVNKVEKICPGLESINYKQRFRGINNLPKPLKNLFSKWEANRISRLCQVDHWDIVWSFDPFRFQSLDVFRPKLKFFHPVDVHQTTLDFELAANADFIFSTSRLIGQKYAKCADNLHIINHGLAEHFLDGITEPKSIHRSGSLRVGYVGNLNYPLLDTKTATEIIIDNPDVQFYFWGPYENCNLGSGGNNSEFINFISNANNCKVFGSVPTTDLPGLIKQMDAFLMVYQGDTHKAELSNPHKVLEYLSTGKVIVSHYIDEYHSYNDLIAMVLSNKYLSSKFSEVINNLDYWNSQSCVDKRKTFASANTYASHIEKIGELIDIALEARPMPGD